MYPSDDNREIRICERELDSINSRIARITKKKSPVRNLKLILPVLDWLIMTVALINTEEKWLLDLYGDEYASYKKRVNRCIPWKRRGGE